MVGSLESLEVAKWQLKAQQTMWEILLVMERFDGKALEENQGALALVLDLVKAFENVGPPCGLGLRAPEASAVRRMCGGAAPDHHGHPRVKVELPAFAYCTARCAD